MPPFFLCELFGVLTSGPSVCRWLFTKKCTGAAIFPFLDGTNHVTTKYLRIRFASVVTKVIDHLMYCRLHNRTTQHQLLCLLQHGFWKRSWSLNRLVARKRRSDAKALSKGHSVRGIQHSSRQDLSKYQLCS